MKTASTTAILALMTASLGLTAIAPAIAQDAPAATTQSQPAEPAPPAPPAEAQPGEPAPPAPGFNRGPRGGGGFGDVLGFERGVEGVEIALVRLSHAIELTAEQQTLFDILKTDALAAAETFATATESMRPVEGQAASATAPTMTERLDNRIALQSAQLAALEAVQPSFTAFFDSLTEEQSAQLMPDRGDRRGGPGMGRDHGPGQHGGPRSSGPRSMPNG